MRRILCILVTLLLLPLSAFGQGRLRLASAVDQEIGRITGAVSPTPPYAERLRLIHALPSNLAPAQQARLRAFLEAPLAEQPLGDLEFNALKNELVFALLRQRDGLPDLAGLLIRMSRAPHTDETWRDYCVQFLGKCHPRISDAANRKAMEEALWEALKTRRGGRAAGSAARQLLWLSRTSAEIPAKQVAEAALEALLDPACSETSRTALLQVCGTLGERRALPVARAIAGRSSAPVLRASAIAAVGMLGDASDLPLLQRLAASKDARVSRPARTALHRIVRPGNGTMGGKQE